MSSCLRASRTRCYSTVHLSLMVTKPALWGSGYTTTGVENSPAPPPTSCYVGRFGFRVLGGTLHRSSRRTCKTPRTEVIYGPSVDRGIVGRTRIPQRKGSTSKTTGVGLNCRQRSFTHQISFMRRPSQHDRRHHIYPFFELQVP